MKPQNRIKRLVIAAEMADGTTTMLYTDDPEAELSIVGEAINKAEFGGEGRRILPPTRVYRITAERVRTVVYAARTVNNDIRARRIIGVVAEYLGMSPPAAPTLNKGNSSESE